MTKREILSFAKETILVQEHAIVQLKRGINEDFYNAIKDMQAANGRMIISGIGKSAIIAQKIVATLNSTGTPSIFMHAADALHGDLGMIAEGDIIIIVSKSGESPEIKALIPFVKNFGNKIIAICGNKDSYLAKESNYFLNVTVEHEACPNNLAPTASTTAQLIMGDALAMTLLKLKGFTASDFAKYHPGGALGKQLYLKMQDLLLKDAKENYVNKEDDLDEVIYKISNSRLGATVVKNEDNTIEGIITDGDLRRFLQKNKNLEGIKASNLMHADPKLIAANKMAMEGVNILKKYKINQLIVVDDNNQYLGLVHLHDMMKEGLV